MLHLFSYENFILAYPWLINILSLSCAYMLSNGKVISGRLVGTFAAINWVAFGFLTDQYAFFFANIIFFFIYFSAVLKFRNKRELYKATFEEQEAEIQRLEKTLDKRTRAAERKLLARELKIKRHAEKARQSLALLIELSEQTMTETQERIAPPDKIKHLPVEPLKSENVA